MTMNPVDLDGTVNLLAIISRVLLEPPHTCRRSVATVGFLRMILLKILPYAIYKAFKFENYL